MLGLNNIIRPFPRWMTGKRSEGKTRRKDTKRRYSNGHGVVSVCAVDVFDTCRTERLLVERYGFG